MLLASVLLIWTSWTNGQYRAPRDERFFALQNEGLFGGDMVLPENYVLRNGIIGEEYRWPGYPGAAIVPYVIDKSLEADSSLILESMKAYHDTTCVRFIPRTNEKEYIKLFKGPGCFSMVGRNQVYTQPQTVSLGSGCINKGTIIHELGHALGFYHEQNRSDRDDYLIVHTENISPSEKYNFKKLKSDENLLLTPFDYDSIMIYGNYAFSIKPYEDMTMEAKNGQMLLNPYEKKTLTPSDIKRVNLLYKCSTSEVKQ